ncbi:DsbA family protein [Roseovarius aestuarii]|uniref:Disulfide bond formation protein D n=1 Tax=Roseovarius aestuarii TaxID=475083 RepID=A0A1X7BRY2_9RHOB|nr:DsbA family protein [Roseovarius aestuarii]SMC12456.1 Disulfide bond formation protein D precursor [Roseovarius aestuarii]
MKRLFVFGAVGLAVAAGAAFWLNGSQTTSVSNLPLGAVNAQEAAEIDTSSVVEMSLGAEDAKVTVVEYASFTCPHCANFHKGPFKQLKADYIDSDQIQFIYRDVYFDRFGLWASMVARCGGEERFFGISDMLYNQQKDWIGGGEPGEISANLRKIGKVAGLGADQIEACLNDSDKAKTLVAWFKENAEADQIQSTPTLVINGEKYSNMGYGDLKAIIDEKLAE